MAALPAAPNCRRRVACSEQLGVSRNTVMRAYEDLCSEGYVEARPASCVAVASTLPESMVLPARPLSDGSRDDGADDARAGSPAALPGTR